MTNKVVTARRMESLAQAAERLGVSVTTLRRRVADGQLRAYRIGPRLLRVDAADVDAMLRCYSDS